MMLVMTGDGHDCDESSFRFLLSVLGLPRSSSVEFLIVVVLISLVAHCVFYCCF